MPIEFSKLLTIFFLFNSFCQERKASKTLISFLFTEALSISL